MPAAGWLLLGVEVDGGDGQAEAELVRKSPGAEVGPRLRRRYRRQLRLLPEQHQRVPVDPHRRPRAHVGDHLVPCANKVNHGSQIQERTLTKSMGS